MANVDGTWETVTKTPMGEQKATLTVVSAGDTFTGSYVGAMGSVDIEDGKVEGDTLKWDVKVTAPMPMTIECQATVDGDAIEGTAKAGAFGSFPIKGSRATA